MKKQITQILTILLALIIANTGFARADQLLCQARCEYSSLNNMDTTPACCKTKKSAVPVMSVAAMDSSFPSDCPFLGSSREVSDPLLFIATSTELPAPPNGAFFTAVVLRPWEQVPVDKTTRYNNRTGLSPPNIESPPPYRLYCSLLI